MQFCEFVSECVKSSNLNRNTKQQQIVECEECWMNEKANVVLNLPCMGMQDTTDSVTQIFQRIQEIGLKS